ncbi:hypothetical protein [Pedobacter hiemivivus]|uniref:Uncharacterized protein n=1 Tax=Pedobacter hiemivivus TaxID=2530454 RepID=A0A4V2MGI2_9SPHI|nr:hypothetical protein [Pedobacter hiemivivus]TCC82696.1 hypothetical protein EZ444_26500 [Pedobacter hiemivivus]
MRKMICIDADLRIDSIKKKDARKNIAVEKIPIFICKNHPEMTVNRLIYLSSILVLSGCVSLKQTRQEGVQEISDLQAFDGTYENPFSKKSDSEFSSLWNQLNLSDKLDTLDFQTATIGLKVIGKDQIRATWLQGDTEKNSVVLKGKLKDSYFVSRHKRKIIPIPLIYGQFSNSQFQLSLGKDGQLHVDRMQNEWGWVFVFLASKDNTSSYEYKRKSK